MLNLFVLFAFVNIGLAADLSKPVLIGGTVFDHFSSYGMRDCREVNPVLGQNRVRQAAIMGASTGLVWYCSREIERRWSPRFGKVIRYVTGFVHIGAGAWNLSQGAK